MRSILNNKKGSSSFEGWSEGLVFSLLFVIIFGVIVIGGMNTKYNKSYELEGLQTASLQTSFENYQSTMKEKITGGEASFTSAVGLTLSTSWNILSLLFGLFFNFITGGWVERVVFYIGLPSIVGIFLRGLFVVSFGFIILRVLFKIKT